MKKAQSIKFLTILLISICYIIPIFKTCGFAQPFLCIVKKDIDIPFEYQFLKAEVLANSGFEVILDVEEAYEKEEVKIKLLSGGDEGNFMMAGKTLNFYLGSEAYGADKTDYVVLGPEEDDTTDIPIPAIFALFMNAKMENEENWAGYNWDQYMWDANARITRITIYANNVKIRSIQFLDNNGNAYKDSQYFDEYENFEESGWENLTLTTSDPTISTDDGSLYLRPLPLPYPTPYSYSAYPSYSWPYGAYTYPSTIPPYSNYVYRTFPSNYSWSSPGSYTNPYFYTPHFPSGWSLASYYSTKVASPFNYSFYNPTYSYLGGQSLGLYGIRNYWSRPFGSPISTYPFGFTGIYNMFSF